MKEKEITVLKVEPGKSPETVTMPNTLDAITHSENRTSLQIRGGKDCWTNSMERNSHQTQRLWC